MCICIVIDKDEEEWQWVLDSQRGEDVSFGFVPALLLSLAFLAIDGRMWDCRVGAGRVECLVHRRYIRKPISVPPSLSYDGFLEVDRFSL